jgi:hypothetical protein
MDGEHGWPLPWPDDRFWVRLGRMTPDTDLKWRIEGSAHTHRGHFHVCAIGEDEHRSVNLSDVIEASPRALIWLAGFLHGQESHFFEFMGRSDELDDAADNDEYQRWRAWNERFRALGYSPSGLSDLPPPVPQLGGVIDPGPWAYVAGLYRVWHDGVWEVSNPQPVLNDPEAMDGWTWPGTPCEARGHHSLENIGEITLCEDCHQVSVEVSGQPLIGDGG